MRKILRPAALVAGALALILATPAALAGDPQCGQGRFKVKDFKLQILHSSDNESSFQDPNTLEPKVLNYAAIVRGLRLVGLQNQYIPLHLTVGDHTIPNPFYQAAAEVEELGAPGIGDIEMFNAMGLVANGMGNHEFDGGIEEFSRMLERARYPFVAVNLDFTGAQVPPEAPEIEIGEDADLFQRNRGKVVKSTIVKVASECVGLIGRAPADFFNVIEDPPNTIPGIDFVGGRDPQTNQPLVSAVDQVLEEVAYLEAKGVNKIFLLDHAQDFTGDPLSARRLRGIDVIIAAGTTGFMAKEQAEGPFNLLRSEDEPEADYPTVREDSEGKPVLVVNSDQQFRYVGNLMVEFDELGNITGVDERSGPIATTAEGVDALASYLGRRKLEAPGRVQEVYEQLQNTPTIQSAFKVVGETRAPLNGNRADVRSRETNLGRLASDSTLWFTRQQFPNLDVDVALKNGGGIRDSITGPAIIRLTIQAALAFDNTLTVLRMSGDQVIAAMENSVSRVPALDGRFPQIAGMQLEYDASRPGVQGQASLTTPSRVKRLVITRADGSEDVLIDEFAAQGDLSRTFVLATNSFTATGGDGYAAFAAAENVAVTEIGEQEILERYIVEELAGVVDLPEPLAEPRVVRLDD